MIDAIRRNTAMIVGAAACGMVFTLAAPTMRMATGAPGPSVLHAQSPTTALLAVLSCLAVAVVIACIVGRVVNTTVGLFVLGAGVYLLANRSGTFADLIFSGATVRGLFVDFGLWTLLILGSTLIIFQIAGPLRDVEPDVNDRHPHWLLSKEAAVSAGAGALVLPVVWAIAQTPMKGQALAAVILGAMAAGLAGRLLSPHVQPKLLFVTVCIFGAIGHGLAMVTQSDVHREFIAGTVNPLSLPMPVDYAAGSLLGVAMGLGWAKSFLHHEEVEPQ